MATIEATASVPNTILSKRELLAQINRLEKKRQILDGAIRTRRDELRAILSVEERETAVQNALHPKTLHDLFRDPSYQNDGKYLPNDADSARQFSFEARNDSLSQAASILETLPRDIALITGVIESGETRLLEMRKEIDGINRNPFRRLTNMFTKRRETLQEDLDHLERTLPGAPAQLADAKELLQQTERKVAETVQNTPYDTSLQAAGIADYLPRTEQSVLLHVNAQTRGPNTITMHLPTSPEDPDFTTTVVLAMDDDDLGLFMNIIGRDIPAPASVFGTTGGNVDLAYNIERQLIPFPLEVVTVDGQKRFRIPEAIWEYCKYYVVKE